VREQIIGRTLGASRQADLYFASFTLPDFLNYTSIPQVGEKWLAVVAASDSCRGHDSR
jgi:hypothetical protein